MSVIELLDRTHVAPVGMVGRRGAGNDVGVEVVHAGLAARGEVRRDVAAHVVLGVRGLLILGERIEQRVRVGDVVAHRSEERIRVVGQAFGRRRLLLEFADHVGMVRVDVDHAELVGLLKRLADACHGELRTRFDVLLDHRSPCGRRGRRRR